MFNEMSYTTYTILRLVQRPFASAERFASLKTLKKIHGRGPDISHYEEIYHGKIQYSEMININVLLEKMYVMFNSEHPADFHPHYSMSVSDIVVIESDGEKKCYFVDSVGFTELPGFLASGSLFDPLCERKEAGDE